MRVRDNEFILGHYRSEWPLKQVILSIFTIHNETLNVWTHLIGFFLFLSLTIYTAMRVPEVVDLRSFQHLPDFLRRADLHNIRSVLLNCLPSLPNMPNLNRLTDELKTSLPSMDFLSSLSEMTGYVVDHLFACNLNQFGLGCTPSRHWAREFGQCAVKEGAANLIAPLMFQPITRWPFFAFLGGAMFCLLSSSICHLLSCHSERLSYIMLRLDYAGIAALISTSFYPPVYYSFMCNPFFCRLYLGFITIFGIATIIFSLLPVFQNPEYRTFRASLFFGMGVSGAAPILHKLILYSDQPEALQTTVYEIVMGAFLRDWSIDLCNKNSGAVEARQV
ncbi:Heptahelical transmembrane protein ADIPOR3 [Vitis vinifera]|uniref:Heptahelical transmembrane protein ADIPOR3 n=1 Tax=Vitis vinifera TaxID=29760 RepID=A0A438F841_VITVI|nr:Heptahelical transmembrane protein ADIPOR3 [Vitis vinifera]